MPKETERRLPRCVPRMALVPAVEAQGTAAANGGGEAAAVTVVDAHDEVVHKKLAGEEELLVHAHEIETAPKETENTRARRKGAPHVVEVLVAIERRPTRMWCIPVRNAIEKKPTRMWCILVRNAMTGAQGKDAQQGNRPNPLHAADLQSLLSTTMATAEPHPSEGVVLEAAVANGRTMAKLPKRPHQPNRTLRPAATEAAA